MQRRTAYVNAIVYGVVGPDGDLYRTIAEEDSNEEIYFQIPVEPNDYVIFEAEPWKLRQWCYEHDFKYYEGSLYADVELELIDE